MPSPNHLIFRLSGELLAIAAEAVRELVLPPRLWRPPAMPGALAGVLDLRGEVVPVVRLERLLGLEPATGGPFAPLIVLRGAWALAADEVLDLSTGAPRPVSAESFNGCVAAIIPYGGHQAHVLAPDRLLQAGELAALREFQRMAERRRDEWRVG